MYKNNIFPILNGVAIGEIEKLKIYGNNWPTEDGTPLRDYIHVMDLAFAHVLVLEYLIGNDNQIMYLNVGTGKDISIKELALKIASKVGFSGEIIWDMSKPDGTPKKQLDISRIKSIGWAPTIELDKGIENTILTYKKERNFINSCNINTTLICLLFQK